MQHNRDTWSTLLSVAVFFILLHPPVCFLLWIDLLCGYWRLYFVYVHLLKFKYLSKYIVSHFIQKYFLIQDTKKDALKKLCSFFLFFLKTSSTCDQWKGSWPQRPSVDRISSLLIIMSGFRPTLIWSHRGSLDFCGPANDELGDENSMACGLAVVLSAAAGRWRELDTS